MFHVKLIAVVYILNVIRFSDGQKYFPHDGFDYHVLDPIKAIQNYCPDYVSCYERRSNDGKNHTHLELLKPGNGTCCIPCQCDDLCFHRGDCCYDKQLEQEHVDRSHINVYRSGKENLTCWKAHTSDDFTDREFLLLQDCTATDTDSSETSLREKCLSPSFDNIEENTPVYSKIDGGHYRNIFCAKCSNVVHDFVPWTVMVGCFNGIEASKLISVRNGSGLQSLLETCEVLWEPPSDYVSPVKCYQPVVPSCKDGDFPADIKVLCTNTSTSASAPMFLSDTLYRNVYCAVCNFAIRDPPERFMPFLCMHGQHMFRPQNQWPLLVVLNNKNHLSETEPNETDNACPVDSVLVAEIGDCVTQTCSQMEMRMGDRCLKIYDDAKGFVIEYRVDAVFSSYKGMDFFVDWIKCEIALQLTTEMNSIYEAKLLGASVTEDEMVLSFSILSRSNELINMQSAFSRFHENMKSYKLNKRHFSLRAGRSPYATIIAGKSLYIEYSPPSSGHACIESEVIRPRGFAMAEIQFCKGFLFDNFKTVASNNAAIIYNMTFLEHEFAYKIDEAKVKRVFMCQNTYFDKLNEARFFESRNAGMTVACIGITLWLAVRSGVAILANIFNVFI